MADNHSVRFNIDASGARRGADSFTASVKKLHAALRQMERSGDAAFAKLGKSGNLQSAVKSLTALSRVKISPTLGKNLQGLATAMASFKGISPTKARSINQFFRTLSSARVPATAANAVAKMALAFRNFKAPTAAQVRNMQEFFNSLRTIRVPRNFAAIARQMQMVAAAANQAAPAVLRFQAAIKTTGFGRFTAGATRATGAMRGLENSMSATYHVGSAMRVMFGALTLGQFTKSVFDASIAQKRFVTTLDVTSSSAEESAMQLEHTRKIANLFGMDMRGTMEEFGKFATAARLSGQSLESVNYVFEQMSGAMRVMGLGADRQKLVMMALTQMYSKGRISAEELRRQLGDQIPGAFEMMQQAVREATGDASLNLDSLLKQGKLSSEAVVLLAQKIQEKFGPQMAAAAARADASIGRLGNAWFDFMVQVGDSGVQQAIGEVADALTNVLRGGEFENLAQTIGARLGNAIRMAGDAAIWLVNNMDDVIKVARALIALRLGQYMLSFGMVTVGAGANIARLTKNMWGMVAAANASTKAFKFLRIAIIGAIPIIGPLLAAATVALAAFWNESIGLGRTQVTVGQVVRGVWYDVKEAVKDVTSSMGDYFNDAMSSIGLNSNTFLANLQTNFKNAVNAIIRFFVMMGQVIVHTIITLGKTIAAPINDIFDAFMLASEGEWGAAAAKVNLFNMGDSMVEAFKEGVKNGYEAMEKTAKTDYVGHVTAVFAVWKKSATEYLQGTGMQQAFRDITDNAISLGKDMLKRYRQAMGDEDLMEALTKKQDINIDDLITEGNAGGKESSLEKRAKSIKQALEDYKQEVEALKGAYASGAISAQQFNDAIAYQKKILEESTNPLGALVTSYKEEIETLKLSGRERDREIAFREKLNDLMEKGVYLNDAQKASLRELMDEMDRLRNPTGVQAWIAGLDDMETAIGKIEENALSGLSDAITDFVMTGKADFRSLAQSILRQFVQLMVNRAMKSFFGGGGPDTSKAEALIKQAGAMAGSAKPVVATNANVNAANVSINGSKELFQGAPLSGGSAPLTGGHQMSSALFQGSSMASGSASLTMTAPYQTGKMGGIINEAAAKHGIEGEVMRRIAWLESKGNPLAQNPNSSAGGLFQFIDSTASQYGIGGPGARFDPALASDAAARLAKANQEALTKVLGRQPTGGEMYLAHQQGAAGASRLLANPTATAASIVGPDAVRLNAGDMGMSSQEFANLWINKYNNISQGQLSETGLGAETSVGNVVKTFETKMDSSIDQVAGALPNKFQVPMDDVAKKAAEASEQASKTAADGLQTGFEPANGQVAADYKQKMTQANSEVANSVQAQGDSAGGALGGLNAQIAQTGSAAQSAQGGMTGFLGGFGQFIQQLMGSVGGLMGGGGGGGGIGSILGLVGGLFKEGGISGHAVSSARVPAAAFSNAPHFASGTANTGSFRGGMPSILHENEAVIPLSKGRKIPVDMGEKDPRGMASVSTSGAGTPPQVVMNFNGVKDADTFRKSKTQMDAFAGAAARRAAQKTS